MQRRTPVVVVAGQCDADDVTGALLSSDGTAVVEHRFDGHVVHRKTTLMQNGLPTAAEEVLELTNCCLSCTVRDGLVSHLRRLHRTPDVARIAVRLDPWMEPEPVCFVLTRSPAARDVTVSAVVATVDTATWLTQAVGDDELDDGRTVAQVVVSQVEFADVVVLTEPDPDTLAVARRLAPRARITVGAQRLNLALANLDIDARRGRSDDLHGSLLAGQPPLAEAGPVRLVEFAARRPFHPARLYAAVDALLDGVVRSRGRVWLATRPEQVMWLESAGGGLRLTPEGKWLAAMSSQEVAYVDPERRAMADLIWEHRHGDRHTSLTVLVCGADPDEILAALNGALLTDTEMARPQDWCRYEDPFGGPADQAQLA
ncbi:ribosome hibernation factor-recruiting GTPase MRF [Mycobacterium sp. SMC-4]|uniref:ribosome hibernation factor-recruiting GTPase MRF n=1 Tax=Mycobacterium sp. SMC-4 TaxID=2857059 RepID=UPI0021B45C06|nr:GTP-binding protein [Mycobacterium sp. SMC-4]UXA17738.1 GTP-binding protein [Mycobacterium sp. SMC-4]